MKLSIFRKIWENDIRALLIFRSLTSNERIGATVYSDEESFLDLAPKVLENPVVGAYFQTFEPNCFYILQPDGE